MNDRNMSLNNQSSSSNLWPGAFGIYKKSRDAVMTNINTIMICYGITIGISIITNAFNHSGNNNTGALIGYLFGLIITPILTVCFLQGIKGIKIDFADAFEYIKSNLWNIVFLQVLIGLACMVVVAIPIAIFGAAGFAFYSSFTPTTALPIILLFFAVAISIVIFTAAKLSLSIFYAVDKKMPLQEAITSSWKNTNGNMSKIFGIIGVSFLIGLIAITIIGIPIAIYFGIMYSAAPAILYTYIDKSKFQPINS